MARTLILDTITEPGNTGTANITLASSGATTLPSVNIDGGSVDGTTLGASTPSTVAATSLSTTGNATVGGTLGVTGTATMSGTTTMNGDVNLGNASGDTITVTGTMAGIDNKSGMTGEIRMWGGASAPTGWLMCNGAAVSRSTYSALFAITSTSFGIGNGSSTFNVPDMEGRSPVGVGTGAGGGAEDTDGSTVPAGGSALTTRSLGEWTGAEVLSSAQLAAHTHTSAAHIHTGPSHTHTANHGHSASSGGQTITTVGNSGGLGTNSGYTAQTIAIGGDESGAVHGSVASTFGSHSHSVTVADASVTTSASGTGDSGSTTPSATGSTGSGSKFTTPIMCVNFIIKT